MEDKVNATSRRCVDCLVVKKVYDACSKRECFENVPFELHLPGGDVDDYTFLHTEFGKAEVERYEKEPFFTEKDECHAKLKLVVAVPVWVVLRRNSDRKIFTIAAHPICGGTIQKDNLFRIPVEATVYAPRDFLRQGRFEPYAECYVETGCNTRLVEHDNILLTLGFFIIIKVVSDVQLKVPNFGFCEIPPSCDDPCDVNFCEDFLNEEITPFPQFFPLDLD